MHINDSGILTSGETTSVTNMARPTLVAGDVITVTSDAFTANDSNESEAHAELLFEHVAS